MHAAKYRSTIVDFDNKICTKNTLLQLLWLKNLLLLRHAGDGRGTVYIFVYTLHKRVSEKS